MRLVDVTPLTYIPKNLFQIYSYISLKPVGQYSLVTVEFRKKTLRAVVIKTRPLNKLEVKKDLNYKLKPIKRVLQYKPCLHNLQMNLAKWISSYYFEPISLILKTVVRNQKLQDRIVLQPQKGMLDNLFSFKENLKIIEIQDRHNDNYKLIKSPRLDLRVVAQKIADLTGARLVFKDIKPKNNLKIIDLNKEKFLKNQEFLKSDYFVLNRLGYATLILCRDCGSIKKCKNCEVPMVYHESEKKLICHHCGFKDKLLLICEICKGLNLDYLGTGQEKIKYKNTPVYTFNKNLKPANIIGVVTMDHILNLPDYQAPERVWHLLCQLSRLAKKLLVQTYYPQHHAFDLFSFWQKESAIRSNLPASFVKLTYKNKNETRAREEAFKIAELVNPYLGPAPAFIPKVNGYYIWNLVLSDPKTIPELDSGWFVERDPSSFL